MSRSAASTILLAAAGVGIAVLLAVLVVLGVVRPIDEALIEAIRAPQLFGLLSPLRVLTEAGSTWAVIVVAGVTLLVGVAIGPWRHGAIGAVVIGLATVGNGLIKTVVARERPELLEPIVVETGYSFPSGHAALGMVGWGILAVLLWRSRLPRGVRIGLVVAAGVVVFLIGLSRVYLGVHYPTDVVAGWVLGGVVVLLFERLTRTVSPEPAEAAVDADPAGPRFDQPGPG